MVAENDPYNDLINSEKNDIRPGFLGGNGDDGKASGVLAAAENAAGGLQISNNAMAAAKGATGAKTAGGVKNTADGGLKTGGLYNKNNSHANSEADLGSSKKNQKGLMMGLAAIAPFLIILLAIGGIIALIVALPILMIGGIDYNLMKVLGFEHTIGILEEVGEHVTAEFMKKGIFPDEYASDLGLNGIDVGQVLANGDFVKTNTYIANIEDNLVAAAGGFSYIPEDEGELAMLFNGKVIRAEDFVAQVESNPTLYAAYSKAADIGTKYYYGKDVEKVYQEMGLSRGNFNNFEVTGNYQEDEEKFQGILTGVLSDGSDLAVGGAHRDLECPATSSDSQCVGIGEGESESESGGTYVAPVDGVEAPTVIGDVSENTQEYIYKWTPTQTVVNGKTVTVFSPQYSDNATERAAEILNTAISSNEPYLASKAFIAVEESIQRARVDGDGPVNHVMNALTRGKAVTYQNVETGGNETSNLSILETKNFRAAVSDSKYDKSEAQNFGRDRIIKTTGLATAMEEDDTIRRTTVATPGQISSNTAVKNGKNEERKAEAETVAKANENLNLSQANKNSEVFQSVIGGNRIIEGGSFLSNTINMQVLGAMPSDSGKIAEYHKEVEKVMARRAEAERATKSPFDISSPYTFLGSIVHNFTTTMLGSYNSNINGLLALNSIGGVAGKAMDNLVGSAIAGSANDEYTTMSGLGCETLKMAGNIEGDLYCTSHNTLSTNYKHYTLENFKSSEIGGDIDSEGKPVEGSGLYGFINYGMDRYSTVGVKNAEVCQRYRKDTGYEPPNHIGIIEAITNFFGNMDSTYDVCDVGKVEDEDKDEDIATRKIYTGAKYSFGSDGEGPNELYSAYVMYDEVKSLLSGEKSAVSKMRDEYKKKHPTDNSPAAIISRRSGITKDEAAIALNYVGYLDMIANYDPAGRYNFVMPTIDDKESSFRYYNSEVSLGLYAWYSKQTEYDDLRTRNFVV
jgi:hypothetical protein